MQYKNFGIIFFEFLFFLALPFFCAAEDADSASDYFKIEKGCGITVDDSSAGKTTCKPWERGSQMTVEGINVGTCICANTCLSVPPNHYYYNDPANRTRQTNEQAITLPVVLAWDHVEAWQKEDGEYLWYWSAFSQGGKEAVTSKFFGALSYVLEIDNTQDVINDSKSSGNIFRQVLTVAEFNPTDKFYPCFFNSGRTVKWRVRPCCNEDGSNCMPEDQAPWWEFTTSFAPEPIIAKDPDWNGPAGASGIAFKGFQIKWCPVWLAKSNQYAKSYKLMATSDEKGAGTQNCHPLMVKNNQCQADDIFADSQTGEVITNFPIQGRQDHALFTRNQTYVWKMKTCFDDVAGQCSDWGQSWAFSAKTDPIGIPAAISPKNSTQNNDLAGLPLKLSWTIPDGANSFVYQASFLDGDQNTTWPAAPNNNSTAAEIGKFDATNLKADTEYKWRARACSQFNSQNCDGWSEWFSFRTTGRPPKAESLAATSGIPAIFSWEPVANAKSYNFSLAKNGTVAKITVLNNADLLRDAKYALNYPDIDQDQTYAWKIQTCAHGDGTVCGAWSQEKKLAVPKLAAVTNINPANGSTIYADQLSQNVSWGKAVGASAYRFKLSLATSHEKQECKQETIEKTTSLTLDRAELNCLGIYHLAIQPCVDSACKSAGPLAELKFTLGQKVPKTKSAFAVCSTGYDDPATPWNEREACQPKHFLLLVKIAIDFVLFRLAVLLLPVLALITGLLFYSNFKTPDIWRKVKLAWKAIAIGYALLLFAWAITGILLQIAGFSGLWFKIL
jgi:hypothetical protein